MNRRLEFYSRKYGGGFNMRLQSQWIRLHYRHVENMMVWYMVASRLCASTIGWLKTLPSHCWLSKLCFENWTVVFSKFFSIYSCRMKHLLWLLTSVCSPLLHIIDVSDLIAERKNKIVILCWKSYHWKVFQSLITSLADMSSTWYDLRSRRKSSIFRLTLLNDMLAFELIAFVIYELAGHFVCSVSDNSVDRRIYGIYWLIFSLIFCPSKFWLLSSA